MSPLLISTGGHDGYAAHPCDTDEHLLLDDGVSDAINKVGEVGSALEEVRAMQSHLTSHKRLLKLIRAFLTAGVMEDGFVSAVEEGTPQGGPAFTVAE